MAIVPIQLGLALGLSLILIAIIIAIANFIHWFGRQQAMKRAASQPFSLDNMIVPPKHFILLRVLLDKKDHASLSTFQFLAWTLLLSFLYVTLWFLQFLNGSTQIPPPIPETLMVLMGISVAVPITSRGITEYKRLKPRPGGETYSEPNYASMLEEDGRPSLLRLQMFLWTLAALAIFTGSFFIAALSTNASALTLGLPNIDPTLLFLMGLSQTGYLGNVAYSGTVKKTPETPAAPQVTTPVAEPVPVSQPLEIRDIIPRTVWHSDLVTVLGSGFGTNKDTLILGKDQIPIASIRRWENTRIEFSMPDTIPAGSYTLRVIAGGNSIEAQITVSSPPYTHRLHEIDADIKGEIWIDDPSRQGVTKPPIGYFVIGKRYHFFYEFIVPAGTPAWGLTQFRTEFYVDGIKVRDLSVLPGYINGYNFGVFDFVFDKEKTYKIEIVGSNKVSMDVEVKKSPM